MAHSSVRFSHRLGRVLILAGFVTGNVVAPALAGPSGGRVISGQGAISQSGPNSTINQGSDRLIIEWQNFDTSASESVRFNQPSSSASVLNRIISGNATVFDGSLFANGNVIIVNGSGIHFGPNSRVDVGSLIASTADISNSNFLNNRLIFDRPGQPDASITNAGTITVRDTGLAALVAPGVENSGLIQANLGTVILAAGEAHTIDFNGDGLMSFTITKPTTAKPKDRNGKTLDALVSNKGEIRADGGTVLLTARQASRVLDNSINMSGVVRANSVGVRNGKIVLFGGKRGRVNVSGKIRARGKRRGQRGGRVHITGRKVAVPIAKIDVTGKAGGGEVLIGGAYKGGKLAGDSSIGYLQSGDLVSILTGKNAGAAGNGYIPTAEGVYVGQDAVIDVSATEAGNGGQAILWADGTTIFNGTIRARGGDLSGDGGFVETSGAGRLGVGATANVDALAPNGRVGDWLLDPLSVTVATSGTATLAQIADASDTTSNLTVDPSTLNNAAANVSIVASDFITFSDAVTMVNPGVGLTATATNAINVNAAVSTNNGDISFRSDQINLNAGLNAGTASVQFARARVGGITVGAANANDLSFTAAEIGNISAGSLIFGSPTAGQNNVSQIQFLAGDFSAFGSVQYNALNSASSNIIGGGTQQYQSVELNANDGVIFNRITDISTSVGAATFNADADGVSNSFDDFRVLGSRDGRNIPAVQVTSATDITINAQDYTEDTATGSTLALSATGAVNFHRSTSGTMAIGDNATGGFSINTAQLGRISAASANFGNTNAIANNSTAVSFGATVAFGSITANGDTINVNTGASITATSTIGFTAPTVNLDGNLTATNGITGTATTVNVLGSVGGAEIQDAVDVSVAGATIDVAAGTYSSFIINKQNLTIDGAGATTIVNAASPAVTVAANGATVQNMLLQGTGMMDDVGILLDGTAAPNLTGVSITNVDFSNLDDGIRSQGNIGDGVAANVDVAISGTDAANPAVFEDFLDTAIDVGDTDGDAVYTVTDVIVRDGDADNVATGDDGFRFGSVGGITINRVDISDASGHGIEFDALDAATVNISNSSIVAGTNGIRFAGVITDAATEIDIFGNSLIQGAVQGIAFGRNVTDATITIRSNGTNATNGIRGVSTDGLTVNNSDLTNVTFLVGGDSAADGNYVTGGNQAIDVEAIDGGTFIVANNPLLSGGGSSTLEFQRAISNSANVSIVNNSDISGGNSGIQFLSNISDSVVSIAGNTVAAPGDAIQFVSGAAITDSTVTIGSANVTVDGTVLTPGGNTLTGRNGIRVVAAVDGDTDFTITDNLIGTSTTRISLDGILFSGGILDTATVTIGGTNQVFATEQAIEVNDLQSPSTLSITGGTYDGTGGALLVDNTGVAGTDGLLNVGAAAYVGGAGSTVFEVLTDTGNAGVDIDFSGAATFDGGANGIRLSGTGIDVLNDTFGTISFGATTAQTGNVIELANGAEFLPGSPTILDATGASFGGTLASALTPAQLLALEDQLVHFPDDNTLGLINTNDLFVVEGESIQTAVNAAGLLVGPQLVTVAPGTFGGSVEVWVDDLTIAGQGATTIIDTDAVDAFANNGDVDNGFQVVALSNLSGGGDVSGVTIDGFSFDTVTTTGTNIGIELGEGFATAASGTTIQNSTFDDLSSGIVANNNDGATTIDTVVMTNIASNGIDFLSNFGLFGGTVLIQNSDITAAGKAIRIGQFLGTGTNAAIRNNNLVSTADSAVQFARDLGAASIAIVDNPEIRGFVDGIEFDNDVSSAPTYVGTTIVIADNPSIVGETRDGIRFGANLSNTDISIGTATATIDGTTTTFGGNTDIVGAQRGINAVRSVSGNDSVFTVANNDLIQGLASDGIRLGGSIFNGGSARIVGNREIRGGDHGIEVFGVSLSLVSNNNRSNLVIAGNTGIFGDGATGDGITILTNIFDSDVTIGTATITLDGTATAFGGNASIVGSDDGIEFGGLDNSGSAMVLGNTLIQGIAGNGIETDNDVLDGSSLTITENIDILGATNGIDFLDLIDDSTVQIAENGTIRGIAEDGILFESDVTGNSTIDIAGNDLVRGGFEGILFRNEISESDVTIAGNTQITGDIFDGVAFFDDIVDSNVTIGSATLDIKGVVTAFAGNKINGGFDGISHVEGALIRGTSVVNYTDNDITGGRTGIYFDGIIESATVNVTNNTNITGQSNEGIFFLEEVENNATVTISGNPNISGGDDGVEFDEEIRDDVVIKIADNTITGNGDGIEFEEEIEDNASVTISGNTITAANEQGVEVNGLLDQTTLAVDGNTIAGGENGIAFEAEITDTATSTISGNTITGGNGIAFNDFVDTTNTNGVRITGNGGITGTNGDGVLFDSTVTDTPIVIAGNTITGNNGVSFNAAVTGLNGGGLQINNNDAITGTNGDGIHFDATVTDSPVTVSGNTISGSDDGVGIDGALRGTLTAGITHNTITGTTGQGVNVGDIGDNVALTIGNNTITGATGVRLGAVTTGAANGVQIINNTRITGTTQHGIHLDGPVTNTPITINGNTEIAGADTGIKSSDTITNATINLDGNTNVTGGVTGVHFESLSGATVNTANTTITGGATGFKAFGSTAAGATSRLNFTNSAIRGTLGAGLRVTTTAGGSGINTNLGGGLTLTGLPSLALSGPNQTLVGDTLSDTRFVSVNGGNYIDLSNGALFEPGRPTIINGNAAFFDGVQVPAFSFPALVQSIENRLNDFDDNNTLGQIFFRPLLPSDVVDVALLINQFAHIIESHIRISNPQTPGDLILRPDYPFDILFGDLLANLYPLGGCLPIFDDTGAVANFSCIAPAHGSDISPFVDEYLADLPQEGS